MFYAPGGAGLLRRLCQAGGPLRRGLENHQYAFALAHGAGNDLFYYGDWIRKPNVAICSCNDGLPPVIFKWEATEAIPPSVALPYV